MKIMALYDTDAVYAARLMEYIKNLGWEDFDILLFKRPENLTDFLKYQPVDILLYGEDALPAEISKTKIKYIFYLCKEKNLSENRSGYPRIFKYQSARKIASEIISAYTELEDNSGKKYFENVRLISVYSPVSGPEKVFFAWSLAKELSEKRKVLFISLELLPTDVTGEIKQKYALSEFLYYLKENGPDNMEKLKAYLAYSEKLAFLSGISHGFDLLSLNREDAEKFMNKLKEFKEYETVIFYLGFYTEASMEIIKDSDMIFLASCNLPYEELVMEEWKRQTELIGIMPDKSKYHEIKLAAVASEHLADTDSYAEHIDTAVRPFVKELAEKILK